MADLAPAANRTVAQPSEEQQKRDSGSPISTHVLVPQEQLIRLRELSRRTRVAQSEYLREAVDDLLAKYGFQPTSLKR
jgi:Ribbon-helix-helix domain